MQDIPDVILSRFMGRLERSPVPASYHAEYLQWLRYYLDFCTRYPMPDSKANRVRLYAAPSGTELKFPTDQPTARTSGYLEAGYVVKSDSPEWDAILELLAAKIKVRHYSRKTLKCYAKGSRGPFCRHPSVAGQLRHPRHRKTAWARKPQDDHDLYPLRPGQDGERA
jgi:hypothetical protein